MGKIKRTLQELNIMDDFLFTELLLNERTGELLVRLIIERALGFKVENLIIEPQKAINGLDTDQHGIRMDVRVIKRNGNSENKEILQVFDIEPNNTKESNIAKRDRYYQAVSDSRLLSAGEDYEKLPELWTIWILPYDPFGKNRMIYFVKNKVEELPEIEYNDGVTKVYLYTEGIFKGSENLKNLLRYMQDSSEQNATDSELATLHKEIQSVKQDKGLGGRYMRMIDVIKDERKQAREEGRQVGITEGRADSICVILSKKGILTSEVERKIKSQQDMKILNQWLDMALNCETVEAFVEKVL